MQRDRSRRCRPRGMQRGRGDRIDGHDLDRTAGQVGGRDADRTRGGLMGVAHVVDGVEPCFEREHQDEDHQARGQPPRPAEPSPIPAASAASRSPPPAPPGRPDHSVTLAVGTAEALTDWWAHEDVGPKSTTRRAVAPTTYHLAAESSGCIMLHGRVYVWPHVITSGDGLLSGRTLVKPIAALERRSTSARS